MKLPFAEPDPAGSERARIAKATRDLATEISRLNPQALTKSNAEEADHGFPFPANFTKGLLHDQDGLVAETGDYPSFVEAINSPNRTLFERTVETTSSRGVEFSCQADLEGEEPKDFEWRGWESPRSGHVYELQGPDAGAVGMAPAPRVGSSELAAEMAEVYALAILRDVPFSVIAEGGNEKLCDQDATSSESFLSASEATQCLSGMKFFAGGDGVVSSTRAWTDETGLNRFERNRRFARTQSIDGELTPENLFRGSTPGAMTGPYISQFLLVGNQSRAGCGGGKPSFPGIEAKFDLEDGFVAYGSLIVDQRTQVHKNCLDYMTDWCSWRDVQNGADVGAIAKFEDNRRFITTPRDLATYVHYDALYEAYLNACLVMLAMGIPNSKGFPEPSQAGTRTPFATFGGPHILSLVCEVATRCLKAVRRQKFNYHRRCRPEAIGGRLTLVKLGRGESLGRAQMAFEETLEELPPKLLKAVIEHNRYQNSKAMSAMRGLKCKSQGCLPEGCKPAAFAKSNLLLPMAFPEGSPMHPAYGAGHATVAGGCVTMLKAFFEMFEDRDSGVERKLVTPEGMPITYVPDLKYAGGRLKKDEHCLEPLTVQGELDKLAANISIGRNMAGVHYYSDYFDSLRMGERIAVGILLEQAPTYGDAVESTFTSFDGDHVSISGEAGSCPTLAVLDRNGSPIQPESWWLRHVSGQEFSEDL